MKSPATKRLDWEARESTFQSVSLAPVDVVNRQAKGPEIELYCQHLDTVYSSGDPLVGI